MTRDSNRSPVRKNVVHRERDGTAIKINNVLIVEHRCLSRLRAASRWRGKGFEVDRANTFGIVVANVVDVSRNGGRDEEVTGGRGQLFFERGCIAMVWIEPAIKVAWVDDHRHAIMDLAGDLVGWGRDDRKRQNRFGSVGDFGVRFPDACHRKNTVVGSVNQVGLFRRSSFLPFEVAIRGDQTSLLLECVAKGSFFVDRFTPRVDHPRPDGEIVGPAGD